MKKDLVCGRKKLDPLTRGVARDMENRDPYGFSPTWPPATRALLSREQFDGLIWEPMCGDGAISEVLLDAGYDVMSTDLIDRGYGESGVNFLHKWDLRVRNIVTNPDFAIADDSARHALRCTTGKVAMFLRLNYLAGQDRGLWFPETPLEVVYVFSRRVPMQRGRLAAPDDVTGTVDYAWFVWRHGYEGEPVVRFLDWLPFATA